MQFDILGEPDRLKPPPLPVGLLPPVMVTPSRTVLSVHFAPFTTTVLFVPLIPSQEAVAPLPSFSSSLWRSPVRIVTCALGSRPLRSFSSPLNPP